VVGRSYDLILYDEAALAAGMDSFNIQLRPTLDTTNSKAIFISTPRGKGNWFKELYDRGGSNEYPQWASIHSDYRENPRVKEDDIKEAKNSMSRSEFAQEYLADFTTFSGQIWQLDENCIQDLSGVDFSKLDIIAGLDLGFKDETALCVIAHDYEEGKFYFIDEYEESGQTTKYHAEQIQRLEDKYGLDYIYIDSAAAQTRYDFAINYDISTINAKKSVLDGIGFVSAMVETGRITIDKDCLNVIDTFDNYRWDPRENLLKERPLHDHYSHMADAIRYALYTHSGHMEILE
jgi:phage terminase large subunit